MCGIFGVCSWIDQELDSAAVIRARDKLLHRGPDDAGIYQRGNVALAHRRLSIIDLSPQGRQPMANEDGTIWTTFNGEIYNFRELRETLQERGHQFASQTDTEVIVHAYEEWGTDCFQKFDGMFALGIWDETRRELVLARGCHGKKPLFYYHDPGKQVVFASTLSPLLDWPTVPRTLNVPGVYDYIRRGYFHAPESILQDVRKVMPGCFVVFREDRPEEIHRHWDILEIAKKPRLQFANEREYLKELSRIIRQAIKKRLISDVPVGLLLSGGVDSSLVAALMAEVSSQTLQTFSLGFTNEKFDESSYGEQVARQLGLSNVVFRMSGKSMLDLVPDITRLYDEPNVDFSLFPTMALARLARSEVTVALSGDGGDELFGGYDRYLAMSYYQRYFSRIPQRLRDLISGISGYLPTQRGRRFAKLLSAPDAATFVGSYYNVLRYIDLASIIPDEVAAEWETDAVTKFIRQHGTESPIEAAMLYDTTHGMIDGILVKVDRATMAYGVEARNPLLDKAVTEFAVRSPLNMKIRGGEMKYALRQLLLNYLPPKLVYRRKMGLSPPLGEWFRNELRDLLLDTLSEDSVRRRGLFKPAGVTKLVQQHLRQEVNHEYILWSLMLLEMWMREYLDRQPLPLDSAYALN
jgi:asparagine synthase (glutamine-hydrolysing)